ncbi:hypothetical protein GCM10011502_01960 [Oceanisphaera marina]|uniref:DUF4202 domain-containing protein n=1 Tax=Oceanisphaera marina TaxID=2017550 RepID=A0ABQ1IAX2_9GAMM|nr:DUF4202 domain-containing protein [Oceanisphaera marina]GGB32535.1 hypothetical protein GCM10011502_01960 [Oceanisphaera marina]
MTERSRLQQVLALIDAENKQDPNQQLIGGQTWPKEYLYSVRMSSKQAEFAPEASELLQIACRAQHIKRWHVARASYPMDRAGYKRWRTDLGAFHGELTAQLMARVGYSTADQEQIKDLLLKKQLKRDPEVQTLEDIICLVFIDFYLADFATRHSEEKLLDIIRKTWGKMSAAGQAAALNLRLTPAVQALVGKALQ